MIRLSDWQQVKSGSDNSFLGVKPLSQLKMTDFTDACTWLQASACEVISCNFCTSIIITQDNLLMMSLWFTLIRVNWLVP